MVVLFLAAVADDDKRFSMKDGQVKNLAFILFFLFLTNSEAILPVVIIPGVN